MLTDEQQQIVNETQSSFRVLAAAGSGKTTTMAHFVKDIISSEKVQESEIMFITFTRFAAKQIKEKVHKYLGRRSHIIYGTFHSVIFKILKKSNHSRIDSTTLYSQRFDEFVKLFLRLLHERNQAILSHIQNLKVAIVDEFQDLDEDQFEFLKHLKNISPSIQLIAIGDLAQNIYRFRGTSNEFLSTRLANEVCSDLKTYKLTTNFRSSPSILNFINALFSYEIRDEKILPMYPPTGLEPGQKPKYYEFAKNPELGAGDYEDNVSEELYRLLRKAKGEGKSVCVIFPKMKCTSYEFIIALLRRKCSRENFPFDIHKIAKEDETCATIEFDYKEGEDHPVQTSTFHSSKGLEWDVTCVVNVSDSLYIPLDFEEESEAFITEKTNLLYVALSRAIKELYIFANANDRGRNRLFARLGDNLKEYCDITIWGEEQNDYNSSKKNVSSVSDLIRKLPQHMDLFRKIMECSENIPYETKEGIPIPLPEIYEKMKMRNNELAFGTFIDWKIKQELCNGESKTNQEAFLELRSLKTCSNWFHKSDSTNDTDLLMTKIYMYFLNMDQLPKRSLKSYVTAARWISSYTAKLWRLVPSLKSIWIDVEKKLYTAMMKEEKTIRDEYLISQTTNFFVRGCTGEIDALSAPVNSYSGLPAGFDILAEEIIEPCVKVVESLIEHLKLENKEIYGDFNLESEELIIGEADMVIPDKLLVEIKCGTMKTSADLRDVGNCKYILQVLTYVALGRHGTLPMNVKKACLINPLTGAWEIYDIEKWSLEDSKKFLDVLGELKKRV